MAAKASAASKSGKVDRRVLRTRRAIMEAFDRLVADRSVDKITVSAIAREADIDRKTFYLHYDSVNDLANSKTEKSLQRIISALHETGQGKQPIERVHIVLQEVNSLLTEHLDVYENIASTLSIDQLLKYFEQTMRPALEHAGVNPELVDDADVRMGLQFYVAGALSLYSTWLTSDHSTPIETVSDTIENAVRSTAFPTLAFI